MITDEELDVILWKSTRGTHYETAILTASKYGIELIEEDVPRLVAEYRRLKKEADDMDIELRELRSKSAG